MGLWARSKKCATGVLINLLRPSGSSRSLRSTPSLSRRCSFVVAFVQRFFVRAATGILGLRTLLILAPCGLRLGLGCKP